MIDHKVIEMIKHHEGVKTTPYRCPALLWTVGVGHVIDPSHARVLLAERKALPIPSGWDRVLTMGEVDEIDWPASMRQIDAGQTTLQADPGTARTSLSAMENVANSEYGAIYVDSNGEFVFKDRLTATASIGATPTVFADDGTGIQYANAVWKLDDTLIFNSAQISRSGGSPQTAINQPSIDKYFIHSYTNLIACKAVTLALCDLQALRLR